MRLDMHPAAGLGQPIGPASARQHLALDVVLAGGTTASPGSPGAARTLEGFLSRHGVFARRIGGALHLTTSIATAERLLSVHFFDYRVDGALVYAAGPPGLPAAVAADVVTIIGLSDRPVAHAELTTLPGAPAERWSPSGVVAPESAGAPAACSTAANYAAGGGWHTMVTSGTHYGASALWTAGEVGTGVTIAALEFAPSSSSDIAAYDACFGLDAASYHVVPIDGGAGPDANGTMEADLDIEQLQTQAPGATIDSYEAPNSLAGWYDMLNPIISADAVKVISISWGMCEALYAASDLASLHRLFAEAAAQGQSVFVAAGDSGAEDCYDPSSGANASMLAVDYPASDPSVTAVGGSVIGSPDTVWHDTSGAGGGGVSSTFSEPSAQEQVAGALSGSCGSAACRGVPDLSADAYGVVFYGAGAWQVGAGTSFAAPLVAGMVADLVPSCSTGIGDLAPRLYTWDQGPEASQVISDITSGNNDFTGAFSGLDYPAQPGYDLASGLGTINAAALSCPQVTAMSDSAGPAGTSLQLTGSHLAGASVTIGGAAATITAQSATSLSVEVPSGSGTAPLVITNPTGAGAAAAFTYGAVPITSPASASATAGSPFSFTVTTAATLTPTISETAPLPAGLSFADHGDGTASLTGTATTVGTYDLSITAANTSGTTLEPFTLDVTAAPAPPPTTTTTTTPTPPATAGSSGGGSSGGGGGGGFGGGGGGAAFPGGGGGAPSPPPSTPIAPTPAPVSATPAPAPLPRPAPHPVLGASGPARGAASGSATAVSLRCPSACRGEAIVRLGRRLVGLDNFKLAAQGKRIITVRLTKLVRAALSRDLDHSVVLTEQVRMGATLLTRKIRLHLTPRVHSASTAVVRGQHARLAFSCSLRCLVTLRLSARGVALTRHFVLMPGHRQLTLAIPPALRAALARSARGRLTLREHVAVLGGRTETATLVLTTRP